MTKTILVYISVTLVLLTLLPGCKPAPEQAQEVEVIVQKVHTFPHRGSVSFVGRLNASSDVKILARVKAKIESINFSEGKEIEAGSILFKLNDDELQAQKKQSEAQVARAQSALTAADKNFQRGQELAPDGYISSSELDDLEAKLLEAQSALAAAEAQLDNAKVDLSYATIEAPISGKIGRSIYSVGDVVSPESGELTTIVATHFMEVPFFVSEKVYWRMAKKFTEAKARLPRAERREQERVKIAIEKDDIYPHEGKITFVSNRVDPKTGTMEVRATIPNPDGILKPGQYVNVIVEEPKETNKVMIPQTAVQSDQQGEFVMLVDDKQVVSRQNVKLGERVDIMVIVSQGLDIGDTIVINGVQRIRSGQKIKPVEADAPVAPQSED
ncbi:efflux RND transporter periplasmic adaptor subunit [Thalassotalea mangrovi]|uniref:Efflux RND transporter periplasmic adaptor subunit n=1 Tax=Thalassotalea mangrovi TaxID=2572245 RepID=A0A4U1B4D4_9GAMM|nr:efflux RND transporter periplasmic adaptor subunit [Thalassotalea mangrovi]TKB44546.1 efflux RND transporter periplasmic adaptor subunit [Thalassotalea mangrovi]